MAKKIKQFTRKRFNPNACPYHQLLTHKGEALVIAGRRYPGYGIPLIDRIRHVSSKGRNRYGRKAHSIWDYIKPWEEYDLAHNTFNGTVSCFDPREGDYSKVINRMKEYDRGYGLKIIHIEFNK